MNLVLRNRAELAGSFPPHSGHSVPQRLRPLWVVSRSSTRALEQPFSRIKLTFTWHGFLVPQQPMPVTVPQRAILAADLAGTGRGIKSEMVASLNRKRWRFDPEYAAGRGRVLL